MKELFLSLNTMRLCMIPAVIGHIWATDIENSPAKNISEAIR